MSVKIKIFYPHLLQFTDNQDVVEVNGGTVVECLGHLVSQFPGIEKMIFDERGQLISYVVFYINGEYTSPVGLDKPLNDGDELSIALMIAGG